MRGLGKEFYKYRHNLNPKKGTPNLRYRLLTKSPALEHSEGTRKYGNLGKILY